MKSTEGIGDGGDRLLMFLFDDVRYALPIAWVIEVAEKDRVTSVPSLALPIGGVMNWHGEALPLVSTELLLGRDRDEAGATPFGAATTVGYAQDQVLVVVSARPTRERTRSSIDCTPTLIRVIPARRNASSTGGVSACASMFWPDSRSPLAPPRRGTPPSLARYRGSIPRLPKQRMGRTASTSSLKDNVFQQESAKKC